MAARTVFARLVRRLYMDPQSMPRNRHFATFDAADGARARRVASHLRSLRADLLASEGSAVVEQQDDGRVMLSFGRSTADGSRVAWLSSEEFAILREDGNVASALGASVPDRRPAP